MHEIAGKNRSGAGADVCEYDADENKERNDTPGPSKLRSMQHTKQAARENDAGKNAGANGTRVIRADKTNDDKNNADKDEQGKNSPSPREPPLVKHAEKCGHDRDAG